MRFPHVRIAAGVVSLLAASAFAAHPAKAQSEFNDLPNPVQLLSPTPGAPAKFIAGLNLGYLYDDYAFDLGPNLVSPRDGYAVAYAQDAPDTAATLLANTGGNVTRIFVFEGAQGLTFDSSGDVSGVDGTFVANLEDELGKFRSRGLSAMLVLMTVNDDEGISNVDIMGNAIPSTGATLQDFYLPGTAQNALVANGIGALADRLHNDGYDSAIFAYEVINEYNTAADRDVFARDGVRDDNYNNLYSFVATASSRIRSSGYPGYVTASTINYVDTGLQGKNVDFLDLHEYNTDGSLPTLDPSAFPVLLGECGDDSASDDSSQVTILQVFLRNAVKQGYAGVLPWYLGSARTDVSNVFSFIIRDGNGPYSTNVRPAYNLLSDFDSNMNGRGVLR